MPRISERGWKLDPEKPLGWELTWKGKGGREGEDTPQLLLAKTPLRILSRGATHKGRTQRALGTSHGTAQSQGVWVGQWLVGREKGGPAGPKVHSQ